MNEFERRALDIAQQSTYLASVLKDGRKPIWIDYFAYNGQIGSAASPIAGGASGQKLIQIQADSDFICSYMSASFQGNTLNTIQITDTGSGKTFFNEPTLGTLVFGSGGFPFLLPVPRVIPANVNLKIDLNNVSGAVNMTGAFFSFMGARVYYAS